MRDYDDNGGDSSPGQAVSRRTVLRRLAMAGVCRLGAGDFSRSDPPKGVRPPIAHTVSNTRGILVSLTKIKAWVRLEKLNGENFAASDKGTGGITSCKCMKGWLDIAQSGRFQTDDTFRLIQMKVETNVFAQLVLLSEQHDTDVEKTSSFPLSPVPWALATDDGYPEKTDKAKLLHYLETDAKKHDLIAVDAVHTVDETPYTCTCSVRSPGLDLGQADKNPPGVAHRVGYGWLKGGNGTAHLVYFLIEDGQRTPYVTSVSGINISTTNHGFQRVQLLKPDIPAVEFPPDTWTFSILAPEVHVPATETTYWWHTTRLPPLRHKHHIIQYEGVIDRGSEDVVHHIEVFHCVGVGDHMPFYSGPGQAENKPPTLSKCRNVIGAWAMGAGPIVYPEEAGSPVGGTDSSPYVLLEIHYNNPEHIQGIVDSSGIRFYVTRQLRQYDSGIMELGLEYTDKMALPPGLPSVSLSGFCVQTCTQVGVPSRGIHIFASQLHTHLTGKKVYTRHVRDDRELPELNRDNHYSPHFQEIRRLPVPVNILPGDALVTTCEYNTVSRKNVTVGGLAITDEMCVNYVHYYPRVDLEVCKSSIDTSALQSFFKFMNKMELQPTSPLKTSRANYHGIDWNPLNIHLLEYLYDTSSLSVQCNKSDGQRFCGTWNGVPPTSAFSGLMHQGSICKGSDSPILLRNI
ncbi:dopamine beta-hydroxylase-like [Haliotis rubra]|uniref:dopamine beta-hydroxylase-like n=1 Tax=Haliotis rubra TaxID=36100 RepID=UPI001EE5D47A|nr:dopamine beta-hydroxylase-like [Haliotis rubra]